MKTASLEDLKRDISQLDVLVQGDESILLTSHGKFIATLTPAPKSETASFIHKPDYAARFQRNFGDTVFPAGTIQTWMDEERGGR
ncbi:MAG: hypothetical protein JWO94_3707 [Verrucomicrobiaceae bacterium]|nr:hypothetical protein [Verrucomicrobiaceae bacterium]